MPDGYTIKKMRDAIARVRTLREEAGRDAAAKRLLDRLGEPGGLADLTLEEASLDGHEIDYLNAFPPRLIEGVRAALHHAAMSDEPPLVELQFLPGYDFEVRLMEWGDQLTIHLRGPFAEPFPRDSFVPSKQPERES